MEKELEKEQKTLEKKNHENSRPKESTLKSNAMFTKSRKKKVSSKRKASIQNRNKELGRPISLNVIYEEPSQITSTVKEAIEDKSDKGEKPIEKSKSDESPDINEVKEHVFSLQENETDQIAIKEGNSAKSQYIENHSSMENRDVTNGKSTTDQGNKIGNEKEELVHESVLVNESRESSFLPPTDENWESRLPALDYSYLTSKNGEASAPIASGVYYSHVPTEEIPSDKTSNDQHQQTDMSALAPAGYVPMVQVFEIEPYTEAHWYPLDVVCRTFREQGNVTPFSFIYIGKIILFVMIALNSKIIC